MEEYTIPHGLLIAAALLSCAGWASAALRCSNCGRTPVPYPLSTAPNCGDPAYKLRCTVGMLWLDALDGSSYEITSISPQTQRIVIRPADLTPGTCLASDFRSQGIQLDSNLPFNITGSNTILLMNCSDAMLHLQAPINCSSTCICHSYIRSTLSASMCKREQICCMFRTGGSQTAYAVRVHGGGCSAYQSFVNLDPSFPVAKWPEPGMEIEWALPQELVCRSPVDCREMRNSRCSADLASLGVRRCFCKRGWRWDAIYGLCRKCHHGSCKIRKNQILLIGATVGSAVLLGLGGFLAYRLRRRTKNEARKVLISEWEEILNSNRSGKSAKIFTGKEIIKATNNFFKDNLLGSGGFGEVYKGTLEDGTITAVKRAKPGNTKGTLQVLNEVRILCQVNHRSLVRLLGCCVEIEQPLLIYEYISNGTLFEHLHPSHHLHFSPLTWHRRLTIALQTAEGLAYLHSSAVPPIYHRDVKSSNILLDEKLDAKVSDFGLSRLVELSDSSCSHIHTGAQGTLGYLDPEYYLSLQLTDRSDVYSFGVVLLELLTSKKAIDFNREEENVNLVVYMKKIMLEERLMDVVDPDLKMGATEMELETMKALAYLAAACLDERRQNRPSMKEVSEEIECIISIVTGGNKT
ncbi:Wall-associated receptor kinase-like [Actinidia chinensis var. chinensis]|uniref:Wall-associated receptor kinase-like n=1 Tax=Actinidia chinensis var. chinensis TaxID=1590841 RepID=A0A2R6QW84_ACTCC|nr:Wall-associated receptor kinase-like [Actinidia chinensis var. chinensis]